MYHRSSVQYACLCHVVYYELHPSLLYPFTCLCSFRALLAVCM